MRTNRHRSTTILRRIAAPLTVTLAVISVTQTLHLFLFHAHPVVITDAPSHSSASAATDDGNAFSHHEPGQMTLSIVNDEAAAPEVSPLLEAIASHRRKLAQGRGGPPNDSPDETPEDSCCEDPLLQGLTAPLSSCLSQAACLRFSTTCDGINRVSVCLAWEEDGCCCPKTGPISHMCVNTLPGTTDPLWAKVFDGAWPSGPPGEVCQVIDLDPASSDPLESYQFVVKDGRACAGNLGSFVPTFDCNGGTCAASCSGPYDADTTCSPGRNAEAECGWTVTLANDMCQSVA